MSKKIVEATKVTIGDKTYICKEFSEIWELFGWNNGTDVEEDAKKAVLRSLLVNGRISLPTKTSPIELEIVPVN